MRMKLAYLVGGELPDLLVHTGQMNRETSSNVKMHLSFLLAGSGKETGRRDQN